MLSTAGRRFPVDSSADRGGGVLAGALPAGEPERPDGAPLRGTGAVCVPIPQSLLQARKNP